MPEKLAKFKCDHMLHTVETQYLAHFSNRVAFVMHYTKHKKGLTCYVCHITLTLLASSIYTHLYSLVFMAP